MNDMVKDLDLRDIVEKSLLEQLGKAEEQYGEERFEKSVMTLDWFIGRIRKYREEIEDEDEASLIEKAEEIQSAIRQQVP